MKKSRHKYSCENRPQEYTKILDTSFPYPAKDTYYWHIIDIPSKYNKYKIILAFTNVFKVWQRAFDEIPPLGPYLHIESTSDLKKADIIISFGEFNHNLYHHNGMTTKCPYDFDGELGVLAHAWPLGAPKPYGGNVHCDSSEDFSEFGINIFSVLLHEIGHVWNIGHSEDKDAVMWPYNDNDKTRLNLDDKKALLEVIEPVKNVVASLYYSDELKKKEPTKKSSGCLGNILLFILILYFSI